MDMLYLVIYGLLVIVTPPNGQQGDVEILFLKTPAEYEVSEHERIRVPEHRLGIQYLHQGVLAPELGEDFNMKVSSIEFSGPNSGTPILDLSAHFSGSDYSAKARCFKGHMEDCEDLVSAHLTLKGSMTIKSIDVVDRDRDQTDSSVLALNSQNLYDSTEEPLEWMKARWSLLLLPEAPTADHDARRIVNGIIAAIPYDGSQILIDGQPVNLEPTSHTECTEASAYFKEEDPKCIRVHLFNLPKDPCGEAAGDVHTSEADRHFGVLWSLASGHRNEIRIPKLNDALGSNEGPPSCRCGPLVLEKPNDN